MYTTTGMDSGISHGKGTHLKLTYLYFNKFLKMQFQKLYVIYNSLD